MRRAIAIDAVKRRIMFLVHGRKGSVTSLTMRYPRLKLREGEWGLEIRGKRCKIGLGFLKGQF